MSAQLDDTSRLPPDRQLSRLREKLRKDHLLEVLDSFAAGEALAYSECGFNKKRAIRICIGKRRQHNGELVTSWAYIALEKGDMEPPVHFRDEEHHPSGRSNMSTLYQRSASSLVRKAQDLIPPFCFMQRNSYEEVSNMRGMLCALVLYYPLVRGLSDAALDWKLFYKSLKQALERIEGQSTYHTWLEEHSEYYSKPGEQIPSSTTAGPSCPKGAIVCSRGVPISPPVGGSLDKFMKVLGKDVSVLEYIPATPVIIERQDVHSALFPYRLLLGRYDGSDVHVYLSVASNGITNTKIMTDSDHQSKHWSYGRLDGLELLEPFAAMKRFYSNSSSRSNKLRFLIAYYFWLAESEGLIDDPAFSFTPETMRVAFCAACRKFREAAHGGDDSDRTISGEKDDELVDQPPVENLSPNHDDGSESKMDSLIVRLRPAPEVLPVFTGLYDAVQNNDAANRDRQALYSEVTADTDQQQSAAATNTPQSFRTSPGESDLNSEYVTPATTTDEVPAIYRNDSVDRPLGDQGDILRRSMVKEPVGGVQTHASAPDASGPNDVQSQLDEERDEPALYAQEVKADIMERRNTKIPSIEVLDEELAISEIAPDAMELDDLPHSLEIQEELHTAAQQMESDAIECEPPKKASIEVHCEEPRIQEGITGAVELDDDLMRPTYGPGDDGAPRGMTSDEVEAMPERVAEVQRATSIFSISSDEDVLPARLCRPIPQLNLQDESPWRGKRAYNPANFIDLSKEDDDRMDMISNSANSSNTPDNRVVQGQNPNLAATSNSSGPRWSPSRRAQWRQIINISDDNDDDDEIMEDVNGDAWRRASLR